MFRYQLDPIETGEPCYNDNFDLLLNLAAESLYHGADQSDNAKKIISEKKIDDGWSRFTDDVGKAVGYLQGEATLLPDPQDPGLIPEALQVLDNAVSLYLLLNSPAGAELELPAGLREQIEMLYLQLTAADEECFCLPLHRLIPLNQWRRRELIGLPEQYRYHFPWYEFWVNIPEYTLEILSMHWQAIMENDELQLLELNESLAEELILAISKDDLFFQFLRDKSVLTRQITDTFISSTHLGLAALANITSPNQPVPDKVARKGFQAAACNLIKKAAASWQDKYERLLLAGLYGPDIDAKKRMELFKDISLWLESNPRIRSGSLAGMLASWLQNPLQARQLLDSSMQRWQKNLLQAAQAMPGPVEYVEGAFAEAVATLQNSQPVSLLDKARDLVDRLRSNLPTLEFPAGVPLVDCLARSAFPARPGTVFADSDQVECLIIRMKDTGQDQIDYREVEQLHQKIHNGRTVITGILLNPPEENDVKEMSCRYLIGETSIPPLFCEYNKGRFTAGFSGSLKNSGDIRLVMIIKGNA